ncbi:MAG: M28 family peptidase [Balneolaceae bacterium]
MKKTLILAVALLTGCATQQQLQNTTDTESLLSYTSEITPEFLQEHLSTLASDEFEGRATGMEGQKKAAEYIADFYTDIDFEPMGDNNSYFQRFLLNAQLTDSLVYRLSETTSTGPQVINHTVESKDSNGEFIRLFGGTVPLQGEIVFAGFGVNDPERSVSNLEGTDLTDKWVMIFEDIPYIVNGDTLVNPGISSNSRIGSILGSRNAKGLLIISDYTSSEFDELANVASNLMAKSSNMSLAYLEDGPSRSGFPKGFVQISPEMASTILDLENVNSLWDHKKSLISDISEFRASETPFSLEYTPYDGPSQVESENVIAYMEGADPELKDEVLVLMAHYDHIGITQPDETGDRINNGADDNGSGTTALMAVANALSEARSDGYRPKRSVLFLHVAAEELGLLGSRYYSDHPVIPIENTVVNFNADMIGRSDPENIKRGDTDYVYLIGGEIISSELDSLVQVGNSNSVNMRLDRRYNDLEDANQFYRRSDHWNFGRLSVPFVFFFTGVHEDYHQPSDSVDKIDFPKLTKIAQLIYASSIEVTNYDGRPEVDNQQFIKITESQPR